MHEVCATLSCVLGAMALVALVAAVAMCVQQKQQQQSSLTLTRVSDTVDTADASEEELRFTAPRGWRPRLRRSAASARPTWWPWRRRRAATPFVVPVSVNELRNAKELCAVLAQPSPLLVLIYSEACHFCVSQLPLFAALRTHPAASRVALYRIHASALAGWKGCAGVRAPAGLPALITNIGGMSLILGLQSEAQLLDLVSRTL